PGVAAVKTSRRDYPEGNNASELLGFIGQDEVGLAGVEADFDRELGGTPAEVLLERDALGNPIPFGRHVGEQPVPGGDVQLTIDRYLQRIVDEKLDLEIERHEADGGTIIVMNPKTGEILAMASRPSFRLSELDLSADVAPDSYRNRAVTDVYPPGSVMKTVTMAGAIDAGLVAPDTTFNDPGYAPVEGAEPIRNAQNSVLGTITMTQVLQYSVNTGAVWLSDLMGPDRFYRNLERFGFGQPADVGLSGEPAGLVVTPSDDNWYPVVMATNSFGQGIGVTPLQMTTAVSALVNGGLLMRPYIVKEVAGPSGQRVFEPVVVQRAVSEQTSQTLVEMMRAVVDGRSGHRAQVPGYHVGGKTGTSNIEGDPEPITSFVGFTPAEDPQFVMLVKIDHPQDSPWGEAVAAPIFSDLAPQILAYLGVPLQAGEALVAGSP
ncbi:MAG: penicillin-binding protein 2, partial [Dehalococcoidia bacterium]|nr:penicillin-binding protein 2 [Dehalococcoidia bacterium]